MGDDDSKYSPPKLTCDSCQVDKSLVDAWWCTVCQGTVCSACAMRNHRNHHCKPWSNFDVVKECLQFYMSRMTKRVRDCEQEREAIRVFCTNLENDLLEVLSQETKSREAFRRISECFTLLSLDDFQQQCQSPATVPLKLDRKIKIVSKLLQSTRHGSLNDLQFEYADCRGLLKFHIPPLEKVADMFFETSKCDNVKSNLSTPSQKGFNQEKTFGPMQIATLLVLLALFCAFTLFNPLASIERLTVNVKDSPVYSLERSSDYVQMRRTSALRVPYFVKSDFSSTSVENLHLFEGYIEENFIDRVRNNCYEERKQKEIAMWKAKRKNDADSYERAKYLRTPNCEQLSDYSI